MHGTVVGSLEVVQGDITCCGANEPTRHNSGSPRAWSPCSETRGPAAVSSPRSAARAGLLAAAKTPHGQR